MQEDVSGLFILFIHGWDESVNWSSIAVGPVFLPWLVSSALDSSLMMIYQLVTLDLWLLMVPSGNLGHRTGKENGMLVNGIINPAINSLLSRARHTNMLIISDQGFPHMSGVETIDISLVAGIPLVVDVLRAIRMNFNCAKGVMAAEFREVNSTETQRNYEELLEGVSIAWEPHASLKARAAKVVGIIRTGDTTRFGNILLEST